MEYCPTDEMVADFFTKPLQGSNFEGFRQTILGMEGAPVWKLPTPGPATSAPAQVSAATVRAADRSVLQGGHWPALPKREPAHRQVWWAGDGLPGARQNQRTTQRAFACGAAGRTRRAIARAAAACI